MHRDAVQSSTSTHPMGKFTVTSHWLEFSSLIADELQLLEAELLDIVSLMIQQDG
jgi:hypothetical protein